MPPTRQYGRDLRWRHPQRGFRHAQFGAGRHQGHVGYAGKTETATHRSPFDEGQRCLRQVRDFLEHLPGTAIAQINRVTVWRDLGNLLPAFLDIAASTKITTRTAKNHRANPIVVRQLVDHGIQFSAHLRIHRVALLGAIEHDGQTTTRLRQQQRLAVRQRVRRGIGHAHPTLHPRHTKGVGAQTGFFGADADIEQLDQ